MRIARTRSLSLGVRSPSDRPGIKGEFLSGPLSCVYRIASSPFLMPSAGYSSAPGRPCRSHILQDVNTATLVRSSALARIGIGTILALTTRPVLRQILGDEQPSSSFVLLARTVGIRDAIFGLGLLRASKTRDASGETRRWVQAWLANEVADVVAAVAASRQRGASGTAVAAMAPVPLIAIDVWILRRLADGRPTAPLLG